LELTIARTSKSDYPPTLIVEGYPALVRRAPDDLKPIITIYSTETSAETKKFEGYITAAFWIGVDHAEGEVASVKIRQPVETYDDEVAALTELTTLLVQRSINFAVEFFTEPKQPVEAEAVLEQVMPEEEIEAISAGGSQTDYEAELTRIKDQYKKGLLSKKQYESKKEALLKSWKEKVEGRLGK
jgi:hypothetical protein